MSRKLLSILFISVLQADTPQKENYESGNGRSKMGVRGSHSNPTHSATGQSSPSQA
ncbi:hypothetical protein CK203_106876 [Vitis vinifera]|uniref:Uncharacterized protein n=1 Tax=Vitis vinifera TaxID=29760 RepID=A0A438EC79_VITVI|nr:hypothetical protein CK203_106876 [Vitis vinifera]